MALRRQIFCLRFLFIIILSTLFMPHPALSLETIDHGTIKLSSGLHNPPPETIPEADKDYYITVNFESAPGYEMAEMTDTPNDWIGTAGNFSYQYLFEGTNSQTGYIAIFRGELRPLGGGHSGSGGTAEKEFEVKLSGALVGFTVDPGKAPVPVGAPRSFQAYKGGQPYDNVFWDWGNPNMPSGSWLEDSVTAFCPESGEHAIRGVDKVDPQLSAEVQYIPVGLQKLKVWENNNHNNSEEVEAENPTAITPGCGQNPEDPPVLYVPFTKEDGEDKSTTTIILKATPHPGSEFPDGKSKSKKPGWTVTRGGEPVNVDIAPHSTNQFQTTMPSPGTYEITAECGNELKVKIRAVQVKFLHPEDNSELSSITILEEEKVTLGLEISPDPEEVIFISSAEGEYFSITEYYDPANEQITITGLDVGEGSVLACAPTTGGVTCASLDVKVQDAAVTLILNP